MAEAKERAAVPESPRIAALRHSLAAGTEARATLTAFWDEVARSGTPLVEAIPGDDGHLLVTFLWRDAGPPEDTRNVVLFGGPAGWTVAHNHLLRLPGTDVWYRSYRVRADARLAYWLSPNDCLLETYQIDPYDAEAVEARLATAGLDPFNRRPYPAERPVYSTVELPGAPPEPFIGRRPGVARGTVQVSAFRSRLLGNERRVWRYTPPATAPGRGRPGEEAGRAPYGLLVVFDGGTYTSLVPTPAILDNLVAAGLVPPMVAVLIESLDYGTRARELTCNPTFLAFLTDELLPWVERSHAVTSDPAQTVVAGSSLGGLTAAYAALRRPDRFGLVLSQSGAFSWSPPGDEEAEWLARQVAAGALGVRSGGGGPRPPARPRFYLNVGLYETGRAFLPDGPSLRLANRHLRDVLRAGGYAVRYAESAGGHDELGFRATFPEGLLALCGRSTAAGASAG